jgi:hypothetical protein
LVANRRGIAQSLRVRSSSLSRHVRDLELHVNIRRGESWAAFT